MAISGYIQLVKKRFFNLSFSHGTDSDLLTY